MHIKETVAKGLKDRILEEVEDNSYRVDCHFHTPFSFDFLCEGNRIEMLERVLQKAEKSKLTHVNIADHNNTEAIRLAREYSKKENLNVNVLAGCEFSSLQGHVIAFGVQDLYHFDKYFPKNVSVNPEQGRYMCDYVDAVNLTKDSGGLVIYPHPFHGKGVFSNHAIKYRTDNKKLMKQYELVIDPEMFDFLELFTGYVGMMVRDRQRHLLNRAYVFGCSEKTNLVAGSDAHTLRDIGNSYAVVKRNGIPDIRDLMKAYPDDISFFNSNF